MTFTLGAKSRLNLGQTVQPLQRVGGLAILLTEQDFAIETGGRSAAEQLECWRRGTSKFNGIPKGKLVGGILGTGEGPHQVKADGLSRALDAVPFVAGKSLWALTGLTDAQQWDYIFPVAYAFQQAARECKVRLRWGGVWDRCLNDLATGAAALKAAAAEYAVRHPGPDFLDGPHFELLA